VGVAVAAAGAAVFSISEEKQAHAKQAPPQQEQRVIFAPSNVKLERSRDNDVFFAAKQLKDVCNDVITLGTGLAEDKAVQDAVLARLRETPELQQLLEHYTPSPTGICATEIQKERAELEDELEWQRNLSTDLTYHADRLADDKVALKEKVRELESRGAALERELSAMKRSEQARSSPSSSSSSSSSISAPPSRAWPLSWWSTLVSLSSPQGLPAPVPAIARVDQEDEVEELDELEPEEAKDAVGEDAEMQDAEDPKESLSSSMLRAAMGVAAVVIVLVVLRKVPKKTAVNTMFASVAAAFTIRKP